MSKKLNSLDLQLFNLLKAYLMDECNIDLKAIQVEDLVEFAVKKRPELKRQKMKFLMKSSEVGRNYSELMEAIKTMKDRNPVEELEEDSLDELESGVQYVEIEPSNMMNDRLLGMWAKNQDVKLDLAPPKTAEGLQDLNLDVKIDLVTAKKRKREEAVKKKKDAPIDAKWPTPHLRLADVGGVDEIAQELLQLVGMPLLHPEIFLHLGIEPPRGILLQGAPGCGKTLLAHAIAGEAGVPFISISAPTIVSGMSGESEKKIREVFEEAKELAPCILFIDEIDAITPKRETAQREMERRIVAQLLTYLSFEKTGGKAVIIIGATNRPDSIDPALRRAGRFDREITLGVPDEEGRKKILEKMCSKLKIDGEVTFTDLARLTPGFVGADLNALMGEAGMLAVARIFSSLVNAVSYNGEESMVLDFALQSSSLTFSSILESIPTTLGPDQLSSLSICYQDFVQAVKKVQPSSKREGFATIPGVSWDDIGALESVREELRMAVVEPIKHPEYFNAVGITSSMGVLLFGPPGCGKTLLAKAVANESHCNFLSVKGPELLNKYVGESERAIRMVFSRAQASSPCVIFFDELDAICPARSNDAESQSSSRLVNTLLTEMDGMQGRKLVFVIAATNRPDMIDPAMLRPGRLDKALYVDLPTQQERLLILNTLTRRTPLDVHVNLKNIAEHVKAEGMSGADLASLVREASVNTVRDVFYKGIHRDAQVTQQDFMMAFGKISPSVNGKDRKKYELLKVKFGTI